MPTSTTPNSDWICSACTFVNERGRDCKMCTTTCSKHQAIGAPPAPTAAVTLVPGKHPSSISIILDILVGTAGTSHGNSHSCDCEEHDCCGSNVLQEDTLPSAFARSRSLMKEETAITVNWVSDGLYCCCIGFPPFLRHAGETHWLV